MILETVLLKDTSMRNIAPNVYFQQLFSVMFWGCKTSKGVGRPSICSGMILIPQNI